MNIKTSLLALMALAAPHVVSAQRSYDPNNEFSLTLQPIGGSLAYAHRLGPGRLLGIEAGIGGHLMEYMVLAGRHFSEDNGLHYEPRDDATEPFMFEMLSLGAFYRIEPSTRWQIDAGLRGSWFLHFDSSDDDPGGGLFGGGYTSVLVGWKRIKLGPQVLVGVFTEGNNNHPEFGVHFAPLMGRLTIGW